MRPTYEPGDMAFLYVGNNIQVNTGDVVLFTSDGVPTIHRAVNVENGVITTQGDANPRSRQGKNHPGGWQTALRHPKGWLCH